MKIYKVGGAVRDSFLGRKSNDIDYAVEADSYQEMMTWIAENGTIWQERPEFFTIRAKVPTLGNADFVLCRKDGFYSDNRRPDSVEVGTIYDDLSRRDFTMNAIAINVETNEIIDPYNGRLHINTSEIRCVGVCGQRFIEDGLRLLRALRFHITLGFELEEDIKRCLNDWKYVGILLDGVSVERIMEELNKMFRYSTEETIQVLGKYKMVRDCIFSNPRLQLEARVING